MVKKTLYDLLGKRFCESYNIRDNDNYNIEWIDARELLVSDRIDLIAKIKYIDYFTKYDKCEFFFDLCRKHIEAFTLGTYTEDNNPKKNSFSKYVKIFNELIIEIGSNGMNANCFPPKDTTQLKEMHNIADDEKVVLAVAPNLMSDNKGGKYVLRLAKMMEEQNVRFIMISVDEEIIPETKNTIILHRIYDKELLAQYYSLADVFVICSERENFPTTCIEAQCCGTPVIGFDTGGTKETAPYPIGTFFAQGDVRGLIRVITECLQTEKPAKVIRELGYELHNKKRMNKAYFEIYQGFKFTTEEE